MVIIEFCAWCGGPHPTVINCGKARKEARITGCKSDVDAYWLIPLFLLRLAIVYLIVLLAMIFIGDWAGFKQ